MHLAREPAWTLRNRPAQPQQNQNPDPQNLEHQPARRFSSCPVEQSVLPAGGP